MKLGLYSATLSGHRKSYLEFVLKLLPSKRIMASSLLTNKSPVLFLMIEDSFILYFFTSILRSITGNVTAGFLFRPKPVVDNPSLKLKIKRSALYLLKKIPNVKTILILPENTHPSFSTICDGWIYDFQFWDLEEKDYKTFLEVKEEKQLNSLFYSISNVRDNRKILCALGGQDRIKGYDTFASIYIGNEIIREQFLFAFGGKVKGFDELADAFDRVGGFSENRFVSDDDLIALYASADLIWTLYAEDYDQASGIFGRAVQLGIPVIVRKDSLIHKICVLDSIVHIAIDKKDIVSLTDVIVPESNIENGKKLRNKFKQTSLQNLSKMLDIKVANLNE